MTTTVATPTRTPSRPSSSGLRVEAAIGRRAFRQVWKSAVVWALVFGSTVAASALTYVKSFPDQASRDQLAATTGSDAGLAILLGPIASIDTVGGYTVYKCFVFLTTIGALWGLLTTTRLLRGEEDAGRWPLVLAGAIRAPRATAATLAALGTAIAVVFAGTALLTVLAGQQPDVAFGVGESLFYAMSLVVAPAVFVGVGALTSQLGRSRRVATTVGMVVFGITFVLRMVADSSPSTRWLLWLTPFGWVERMRPLTDNDPAPLVLVVITVVVLVSVSTMLAGRRDVGAGVLASRDVVPLRRFGLGSPLGLVTRLELPTLVAWWIGTTAAAFAFGIIAKVATGDIPSSLGDTLDKYGVQGTFLKQFLGIAFLLLATMVALLPAGQLGAAAEEETSGRLVNVLVQPVSRRATLASRLLLAAVGVAVAGVLAGLASWAGAATQGLDAGLGSMLIAGLNVVPTALVALGIGAVVRVVAPRRAAAAVYAVVIWSSLVDLVGPIVPGLAGLERVSLFHTMARAPAGDPDPLTIVVTILVALVLITVAIALFDRRDVETG